LAQLWEINRGNNGPAHYDDGTANHIDDLSYNGERHFGSGEVLHPFEEKFSLWWAPPKTESIGRTVLEN
jgi:hypothetical protein